ncbi:uncharacterized protein [Epargyreus clarus]|uniref:uncharacterized protein isoform X2 n=1 Tax=Epargyreus clarus TaxID=520877 RepID=UPI003C2D023F
MARIKTNAQILSVLTLLVFLCNESGAKTSDNKTNNPDTSENDGPALLFADELKQTIERYLFGICPQTFKSRWSQVSVGKRNSTIPTCDLDAEQQDLAGRFATLALRAHSASRSDCARLGVAIANTLGELARTAATRHTLATAAANEVKKRKLSKSQKKQILAKQRTALAVKKKAAAVAAAAAAKMTSA